MSRFDADRLARLDAHMAACVADGTYERLEWALGDRTGLAHRGATGAVSLYRVYSMTKPVVSVIALQLLEEGRLHLFHPVARWLPEFARLLVFTGAGPRPASRRMLVHHLMTHRAGLSYGFMGDASGMMMNAAGVHADASFSLREEARRIAAIPLQFEPGARFLYSVATDVLAALIEEIEGAPLGEIIRQRVTGPLGMEDTSFHPGAAAAARIAPLKGGMEGGLISPQGIARTYPHDRPDFARGGHGLFSTLEDYAKFAHALLLDVRGEGAPRLLSQAALAHATRNHCADVMPIEIELPPKSFNPGLWGQGFGLGFSVSEPGGPLIGRPGAFGWSGAAETWFVVDPASDLFAVLMAQNFDWPGASYDLQNMGYAALAG
ncbi:MAG: serine hydrolase domain-containing protein [Pikeienuella sp.]